MTKMQLARHYIHNSTILLAFMALLKSYRIRRTLS